MLYCLREIILINFLILIDYWAKTLPAGQPLAVSAAYSSQRLCVFFFFWLGENFFLKKGSILLQDSCFWKKRNLSKNEQFWVRFITYLFLTAVCSQTKERLRLVANSYYILGCSIKCLPLRQKQKLVKNPLIPAPPLLTIVPGQKPIVVLDIFIDIVGCANNIDIVGCANNVAIPLPTISKNEDGWSKAGKSLWCAGCNVVISPSHQVPILVH